MVKTHERAAPFGVMMYSGLHSKDVEVGHKQAGGNTSGNMTLSNGALQGLLKET